MGIRDNLRNWEDWDLGPELAPWEIEVEADESASPLDKPKKTRHSIEGRDVDEFYEAAEHKEHLRLGYLVGMCAERQPDYIYNYILPNLLNEEYPLTNIRIRTLTRFFEKLLGVK